MELFSLLQTRLFGGVGQAELAEIFAQLKVSETNFSRGDILAMQGEPVNRLIFLTSGSVWGEMSDPAGSVVKVEDIVAPNPLAILFLFGSENRFPVQVTANEDGTALIFSQESVLRMLSMNETLLKNYLNLSADFAVRLSRKLDMMSLKTIRQKLAAFLLVEARLQHSDTIRLDRSKTSLASYFGVARPSLQREIARMEHDGLIAAQRQSITILRKIALSELS